jgi:broad specificity phosphatase PhoE
LSKVYLVRHGQAGTREAYDSLSDLGRRQSRMLGEYFISQGIEFAAAYSGNLSRQQQTASEVATAYLNAGNSFPEICAKDCWNEFDLAQVYREIGPQLREADSQFRIEYDEMQREVRQSAGLHEAQVHRRWRPCDTKIVEAWISGRFSYGGESWKQFCERVASSFPGLNGASKQSNTIVFTSATPIGVLTGLALDLLDGKVRQLAGVLYIASYTLLRERDERLTLLQFNAVPHIAAPELRTHR